ncbi:hypothetical protein [Rhizobium sp. AG207R]|uniref:hypothetical protein n=1 Tax=Rhizobium sp. AG207R TaxID=2802287 RepID=UPI0022AC8270|nr:hypothetical protein [Rhizobium sp. AG207R]MCZ3377458.1 hypothetical protein [Rhizobium sp. AG207R]
MSDLLRMDYINSLPQPFFARFCGDSDWWPVNDFEVETGRMRIDVCGKLDVKHFGEVMEIRDGASVIHDSDTFYSDWEDDQKAETSREASPAAETVTARRGADASKVVCPALTDDAGGMCP